MMITGTTLKPFVRRASLENSRWLGGHLLSFLATGANTAGQIAVIETLLMPGEEPPIHLHILDDEAFYILEGSVAFRIGDETTIARAGEFVLLPRGVEHNFRVVGGMARALLVSAPAGLEQAFETLSVPATDLALRHNAPQTDPTEFINAFAEAGIIFGPSEAYASTPRSNPSRTIRPALGRSRWYFNSLFTPLVTGEDTGGRLAIIEVFGRRQQGPPTHIHNREEEAFYILEGEARVHCGDAIYELRAGDFIFLPRGIPHRPEITTETGRALLFVLPASFEKYFEEHSVPATALSLPPSPPAEAYDPGVMARAAKKYGFDIVEPVD